MFARLLRYTGIVIALCATTPAFAQDHITVFAAASLRNAFNEANAAFTEQTGIKVVASYAATAALVKQIEHGAPADIFTSADLRWMDYASGKNLVKPDTRINLLGNKLVLIASKSFTLDKVTIGRGFDIADLAGDGRIAIANVKAVPAGRYAKAALQSLGVWQAAESKLAQAENVRAALAYVGRGEAPVGVVYATDARIEAGVKVIGVFPDGSHPAIIYPVAATAATTNPAAPVFLRFLRTSRAKEIFLRHGFRFLIEPVL